MQPPGRFVDATEDARQLLTPSENREHHSGCLAARMIPATLSNMADDDKILRFPGANTRPAEKSGRPNPKTPEPSPAPTAAAGPDGLTEDQRKAMQIVLSGMSFVVIGIKPSGGGADFFTAVQGDPAELRNAQDHLGGVIERAFSRKGL